MCIGRTRLGVFATVVALLAVAWVAVARSQGVSCTQVQDLVDGARGELDLGARSYDNSCGAVVVPAGFRLVGRGDATVVLLRAAAGDPMVVGKGATVMAVRLQVRGAANDMVDGLNPCAAGCGGVRLLAKSTVQDSRLQGTRLGFVLAGDHVRLVHDTASKNTFGVYQAAGNFTYGNASLVDNDLTGNSSASVMVGGHALDSALLQGNHLGFGPRCMAAEAGGSEFAVSNVLSVGDSCEAASGTAYSFGARKVSGLFVQPHTAGGLVWQGGNRPSQDNRAGVHEFGAGGDVVNGPMLGLR